MGPSQRKVHIHTILRCKSSFPQRGGGKAPPQHAHEGHSRLDSRMVQKVPCRVPHLPLFWRLHFRSFRHTMGLDQGCPISPITFLFYNSNLINVASNRRDCIGLGFIDDMAFTARGRSQEEVNRKLKELIEKDDGALAWGREHKAEFKLDKTALLCATRGRVPDPNNRGKSKLASWPPITIQGHHIQPFKSVKFLGVIIDNELRFKEHAAHAIAKGTKYVLACSRMTKVSKGVWGTVMKRLYEAVAIPKMLYVVDIWGMEMLRKGRGKREKGWGPRGFAKQINKVQQLAMVLITGGMRSTAICAHWLPTNHVTHLQTLSQSNSTSRHTTKIPLPSETHWKDIPQPEKAQSTATQALWTTKRPPPKDGNNIACLPPPTLEAWNQHTSDGRPEKSSMRGHKSRRRRRYLHLLRWIRIKWKDRSGSSVKKGRNDEEDNTIPPRLR